MQSYTCILIKLLCNELFLKVRMMHNKKKAILVVDDEIEFLKMIRVRLEANGYEVVTAVNGEEAIFGIGSVVTSGGVIDFTNSPGAFFYLLRAGGVWSLFGK